MIFDYLKVVIFFLWFFGFLFFIIEIPGVPNCFLSSVEAKTPGTCLILGIIYVIGFFVLARWAFGKD